MKKSKDLVIVYEADNELEAQVIKSLLEGYDIPCFLRSNVGPSPFGITMDKVKVMVPASTAEAASALIEEKEDV